MTGTHAYTVPGVYTVTAAVTCGGTTGSNTYQYVVVFDPSAGFVTGGGWIDSPQGAFRDDESLVGRASFGFVSRYQKGTKVPTGKTDFRFHARNLNFSSETYEWLVIAGARAQYKGVGTINGIGNFRFLLTATDGQINGGGGVDRFRIKIWDGNDALGRVVYDNQLDATDDAPATMAIGGGSIVIHAK